MRTGILKFSAANNPCIFIPKLNKVVFGSSCWWGEIEDINEFSEISDEDINEQWYIKMLKAEFEKKK